MGADVWAYMHLFEREGKKEITRERENEIDNEREIDREREYAQNRESVRLPKQKSVASREGFGTKSANRI